MFLFAFVIESKYLIYHSYVLMSKYLIYYIFGLMVIFGCLVWSFGHKVLAVRFLYIRLSRFGLMDPIRKKSKELPLIAPLSQLSPLAVFHCKSGKQRQ